MTTVKKDRNWHIRLNDKAMTRLDNFMDERGITSTHMRRCLTEAVSAIDPEGVYIAYTYREKFGKGVEVSGLVPKLTGIPQDSLLVYDYDEEQAMANDVRAQQQEVDQIDESDLEFTLASEEESNDHEGAPV